MLETIKKRKTCFCFSGKKVSDKKIKLILEAGRYAPSSHNSQDWKFIVVKDKKKIEEIVCNCTYGLFHHCPPIIIALVAEPIYAKDKKGLLKKNLLEKAQYHKYLNIGALTAHMVLMAESLGINTAILSTTIKETNKLLHVPKKSEAVICIALGYEDKKFSIPKEARKELKEIVRYEKYNGR
ncbi:MAG: nitroreductase family protein [Candidatus Woesearchaeota archaeon]